MADQFKILIVTPDQNQASEYATQLKREFAKLPLQIDFSGDGGKAIYDFSQKYHHLIISEVEMPVMDGLGLMREVRKLEGSTVIFLLGAKKVDLNETGVEFFKLPIVNWTTFFSKVEDVVPEEIKSKFGLQKRDTALQRRLQTYVQKFLGESGGNLQLAAERPVCLIPKYFDATGEENGRQQELKQGEVPGGGNSTHNSSPKRVVHWKNLKNRLNIHFFFEWVILLGLLSTTTLVHKEEALKIWSQVAGKKLTSTGPEGNWSKGDGLGQGEGLSISQNSPDNPSEEFGQLPEEGTSGASDSEYQEEEYTESDSMGGEGALPSWFNYKNFLLLLTLLCFLGHFMGLFLKAFVLERKWKRELQSN